MKSIFLPDQRYEGVRPINIYLLRLLYILMFFVLGKETWTHILTHQGPWDPIDAVAWCVWTAFAMLAGLGIIRPLKMLPIVLLEIFYKLLWLGLVAYPGPVVKGNDGRVAGRRDYLPILVGNLADRRRALGLHVCELRLQAKRHRTRSLGNTERNVTLHFSPGINPNLSERSWSALIVRTLPQFLAGEASPCPGLLRTPAMRGADEANPKPGRVRP